jgi:dGTPase
MSPLALKREEIDKGRTLAPYATDWRESRGRFHEEPVALDRTPYQRDRDRVIHSDAFRRLQYKTQVFVNFMEGDHFRTRLTHSLEVAQITRTICRSLGLDEDLGEVISLSHDMGHPPFGHAGEDALDKCVKEYGGWRHNEQTMRVIRELESPYGSFEGLNLTWETLEGIAKHNGPIPKEEAKFRLFKDLEPETHAGLEAQVAALADDMAYNHHDLDDGLRAGSLHLEQVMTLPQFHRAYTEVSSTFPNANYVRTIKETIRRMLSRQVQDVLTVSRARLAKEKLKCVEDVRNFGEPLICMSPEVMEETQEIKKFLFQNMYRHYIKNRMDFRAHKIITDLFEAFLEHRRLLPDAVQEKLPADANNLKGKALVIADYISLMTDRSVIREHARLFSSRGISAE